MNEALNLLAHKLGIATKFCDAGTLKKEYVTDEKTIRFFAEKLGYPANTDKQIETSLKKFEDLRLQKPLEDMYVREESNVFVDLSVLAEDADLPFDVFLKPQNSEKEFAAEYDVADKIFAQDSSGVRYCKIMIKIVLPLEIGYYDLKIAIGGKVYESMLAVAPFQCYENPEISDKKPWGFALQLYSLQTKRSWGVGDFSDLADFSRMCAYFGADIIGLNPLNALMHDFPENASPYSSISRLFLNPIYIDVEAVPLFLPEDMYDVEDQIEEVKNSELIEYEKVYPLKMKVLEKIFLRMMQNKRTSYYKEYKKFCEQKGRELENFALFETIYHEQKDLVWGGSNVWPQELKNPKSDTVREYLKKKKNQVEFFKFLQFEAQRQFENAHTIAKYSGLKIGFYRDLPVGVCKDSAELWQNKEVFLDEAGAGAPPDAFFSTGQKWCLGAFNPFELKKQKYEPFIKILRANMMCSGALRVDHVMSLMRLYIIPDKSEIGTYIMYNFNDMLNILALESVLNKCMIVGESIGNVPDGFLDKIHQKGIYSLSVLWAERWAGCDWFKNPQDYPADTFASVGTHDMTPLRMWWFGGDIELKYQLKIIKTAGEKASAYKQREADRKMLLDALDYNQVWPKDNLRTSDCLYGEGYPNGLTEAVEAFVAKSSSKVFLAQPEDIFEAKKLQNLPGTDRDKHPNWRRKLLVKMCDWLSDERFIRCIRAIKTYRG